MRVKSVNSPDRRMNPEKSVNPSDKTEMARRLFRLLVSVGVAALCLWAAFRGVDFQELGGELSRIRWGWIIPFFCSITMSHVLRAERWRLLLADSPGIPARSTLFGGVMTGYMVNALLPRFGEVARPLYVSRQSGLSGGRLLGTIVLERVIDLVSMLLLLVFSVVWLLGDPEPVYRILGTESWNPGNWYWMVAAAAALLVLSAALLRWVIRHGEERGRSPLIAKTAGFLRVFWQGILSVRSVKNWPLFLLYTAGIWTGYIAMAWFPFWMLDFSGSWGIGFPEAVVVTMVSAVGVAMPVPGGIGSYHLFVQQAMGHLYGVPVTSALTYATVTHATTLLFTFLIGAFALWFDKLDTLRKKRLR